MQSEDLEHLAFERDFTRVDPLIALDHVLGQLQSSIDKGQNRAMDRPLDKGTEGQNLLVDLLEVAEVVLGHRVTLRDGML
jgi:hypothetical protein